MGIAQRLQELQEAAREQETQVEEVADMRSQVAAAQTRLSERLEHCSKLQDNLHARVGSRACFIACAQQFILPSLRW